MAQRHVTARPIIVSPLAFERRVLRRAGLGERCELFCCGPGPSAMRQWAGGLAPTRRPVFLAGLVGSLHSARPTRSAYVIDTVLGEGKQRWEPTFRAASRTAEQAAAVIISTRTTLTTPQAKRAWADRSGAVLVDRESAAFAEAATKNGWRWAIVRGVSDGPNTSLPADIDAWVDERGRSRIAAVFRSIIRRPGSVTQLIRLRADGIAAMQAVGELIERMLGASDEW